jgi:single-stranded-DNA-specific exonuclease
LGVQLLLAPDNESAAAIAEHLDACNRERQRIEEETLRQAIARVEGGERGERTIVLADRRWHPGVIGIVASRLVERYHRPVVLIALDGERGKGSARSIAGFHLYRALQECSAHLEGYGGHECAAGLTVAEPAIGPFTAALEATAQEGLSEEALLPRLFHDGEVLLEEVTPGVVRDLLDLGPFGAGNPEPSFIAAAITPHQVSMVGEKHLRFTARQGGYSFPCIGFGMAERLPELRGEIDILFTPMFNDWRGNRSVQLRIRDCRSSLATTHSF